MVESLGHLTREFLTSFSGHVKCSISFDKEVHFPGEIVTGTIELQLTKSLDAERKKHIFKLWRNIITKNSKYFAELSWKLKGYAAFEFEIPGLKYTTRKVRVDNNQTFLTSTEDFISQPTSRFYMSFLKYSIIILNLLFPAFQPGKHVFRFQYTLPKDIPRSLSDEHGFEINYTVSLIIHRRIKYYLKYDGKFKVVKQIDWNLLFPEMHKPVVMESTATFRNFLSASVPMTMKVSLPTAGFVVGQDVPITAQIDNDSEQSIDHIEIRIIKIFQFKLKSLLGDGSEVEIC
jgi:hypothetical protein